jgi:hypothetical protein
MREAQEILRADANTASAWAIDVTNQKKGY